MRLIDITSIPESRFLDFLRVWSMKNPEVEWRCVHLGRLVKKGKTFKVGTVLKTLLVDAEGMELLSVYHSGMVLPVKDGIVQIKFGSSYDLDSRYKAERGLAPDVVITMETARVDEEGQRWLHRVDRTISSLPIEMPPEITEADIQWSRDEMMRRETDAAVAHIQEKWRTKV